MILVYKEVLKSTTQGPRQENVLNRDKKQHKAGVFKFFFWVKQGVLHWLNSGILPKPRIQMFRKGCPCKIGNKQHQLYQMYITVSPLTVINSLASYKIVLSVLQRFIPQKSIASAVLSTLDRFVALEGRYVLGGLSSASIGQGKIFVVQ